MVIYLSFQLKFNVQYGHKGMRNNILIFWPERPFQILSRPNFKHPMLKMLWSTLTWLYTKDIVIITPDCRWKELVNVVHLHILFCYFVGLVLQFHSLPSFFSKNCFIFRHLHAWSMLCSKTSSTIAIPNWSGSHSLLNQTRGIEIPSTIPKWILLNCSSVPLTQR